MKRRRREEGMIERELKGRGRRGGEEKERE